MKYKVVQKDRRTFVVVDKDNFENPHPIFTFDPPNDVPKKEFEGGLRHWTITEGWVGDEFETPFGNYLFTFTLDDENEFIGTELKEIILHGHAHFCE